VDVFVSGLDNDSSALELTNLTEQPCSITPYGSGTSLSFIGKPFDEASILALAEAYQDITPYHTNRPPSFIR
jgi:Asp-tRNA(Asn)/Glu-tRNA(Gln) amidotransferase A subunit family amidase